MKKIVVVFGTRPEAIKLAPVIEVLKRNKQYKTIVCSTGQHREMLSQVLRLFKIKVDIDLNIMKPNQDLFDITAGTLQKMRDYLLSVKPDLLIVQGDTTTAFAAALAAFYLKIRVAHVEAALRSFNKYSPFPEEVNRRAISVVADVHFAPTAFAAKNLFAEGAARQSVYVTGNTVVDSLKKVNTVLESPAVYARLTNSLSAAHGVNMLSRPFVLITLHRREKFGPEFSGVLKTIVKLSSDYPEYNFVYPVHLNPNVKAPVGKILAGRDNVLLLPPLDYLNFLFLMKHCRFIITDSGGIQEECFTFRKPVMVLRDVTERMEAVQAGYAFLLGSNENKIRRTFSRIHTNLNQGHNYFKGKNPYGSGNAADKIVTIINKMMK